MINLRNILILLAVVFYAACAISKKENEHFEKNNVVLNNSQNNTVLNDTISNENLIFFERRVMQKLVDFYDYLNILGHESFNNLLMNEVRSSAEKLFFDCQIKIDPYKVDHQLEDLKTVETLLKENSGDNAIPKIDILNIEIIEGLQSHGGGHFEGKMRFDIKIDEASIIITKEAGISLRKIEKKLGEESIPAWEVFLDSIY